MRSDARLTPLLLAMAATLAAATTAFAYWPGLMTWDAIRQYGEALSGDITDWHPPAMQWVWQRLIPIEHGPAPMLILQLGLYWGGLTLIAATMRRRLGTRTAWALLGCGLLPLGLAVTGAVLKDCLMAGALLTATGLIALRIEQDRPWAVVPATLLLVFAAALRFNAFAACAPLLVTLLPARWRRWPRLPASLIAMALLCLTVMPIANRLIGAEPTGVELSLVIFDLGGITEHSGAAAFPAALDVTDPVAANHRCFRPDKWDSYSDWVAPECPLGFSAWRDQVSPLQPHPQGLWLRAIAAHPIAYAAHRLTHFALNTRLLPLAYSIERPVQQEDAPNDWGYRLTPNPVLTALDTFAVAAAHTPLGWPIVWIALAFGALVAGGATPGARLAIPLAVSSFLYGCGYLVFSVAAELRYHLWTGVAALLATVLVVAGRRAIPRRRFALAYAPLALVLLVASIARL